MVPGKTPLNTIIINTSMFDYWSKWLIITFRSRSFFVKFFRSCWLWLNNCFLEVEPLTTTRSGHANYLSGFWLVWPPGQESLTSTVAQCQQHQWRLKLWPVPQGHQHTQRREQWLGQRFLILRKNGSVYNICHYGCDIKIQDYYSAAGRHLKFDDLLGIAMLSLLSLLL